MELLNSLLDRWINCNSFHDDGDNGDDDDDDDIDVILHSRKI